MSFGFKYTSHLYISKHRNSKHIQSLSLFTVTLSHDAHSNTTREQEKKSVHRNTRRIHRTLINFIASFCVFRLIRIILFCLFVCVVLLFYFQICCYFLQRLCCIYVLHSLTEFFTLYI